MAERPSVEEFEDAVDAVWESAFNLGQLKARVDAALLAKDDGTELKREFAVLQAADAAHLDNLHALQEWRGNVNDTGEGRWVYQTKLHAPGQGRGNCTEAAVASILGVPLDEVGDFRADGDDPLTFWQAFERVIKAHGFEAIRLDGHKCPEALHLACGKSARGVSHMVVKRGDELVHDPHPSNVGLLGVEYVFVLVALDPMCSRAALESK